MLRLGSIFWTSKDIRSLAKKFQTLGFVTGPSRRYPDFLSIYFGPEALEITPPHEGCEEGVASIEFRSDDIIQDYEILKTRGFATQKAQAGKEKSTHIPLWYGFPLSKDKTPGLKAFVVMDSPETMKKDEGHVLPIKHGNSSFGLESLSFATLEYEHISKKWSEITQKPPSKLKWNEFEKVEASRITLGEKFLDFVPRNDKSNGVFMITLLVTELEKAKDMCLKAGAQINNCASRDGFIVDQSYLNCGIHLRFVRASWKPYLPVTNKNTPYYRREDTFRPLGGTHSSTLKRGFLDHWGD